MVDLIASPHAHDRSSVSRIMFQVCLALTPATLFGFYLFGLPALFTWLLCCGATLGGELLCLKLLKRPLSLLNDGSALLTGWLLAVSLPPWAPWWISLGGGLFAILIGKHLYGGIGQNIFNPAMLGRTALLIACPLQMTSWALPHPIGTAGSPDFLQALAITFGSGAPDGATGATALGNLKTAFTLNRTATDVLAQDFKPWEAWLGFSGGSFGETSEILILLGGIWLLGKRLITWEIPVAMLAALVLLSGFLNALNPDRYAGPLFQLSSGGVLLGAFFIATDPVTSPVSRVGRLVFGSGCGLITYVIRTWGGFPEAVGFAVLFMNALTPLLDRYLRPRVYGRSLFRKPLRAAAPTATVKEPGQV